MSSPRTMRVLHVQKAGGIGGSERHLAMLLPALSEAGVHVRMIAAVAAEGELFVDALRREGVDVRTVAAGPDANPALVQRLAREIRAFDPDLVHTHLIHADMHGQPAARLRGVPAVSSLHDMLPALRREPVRTVAGTVGRLPRLTIAISDEVRRYAEAARVRPRGRIRVVHYGIDPAGWEASPDERAAARERLGIAPDDVVVAMTSRLIPGKGHAALIDAFADARADAPALRLLIAGDGPLRAELAARAAAEPGVTMLGFQDDVRPLVQAADLLAFPTEPELGEGFGLSALEAMAAARPVVATAVGAIPEVVEHGRTGLLVPAHDRRALAAALARLADAPHERDAMGRRGAERAAAHFSLEALCHGTVEVYREALGRPAPTAVRPIAGAKERVQRV
jgi:glycosyltransferase involved in cell wall biosynthesis